MPLFSHPFEQHYGSDLSVVLAEHHHGALVTQDVQTVCLILSLHALHLFQLDAPIDLVRKKAMCPHEFGGQTEVSVLAKTEIERQREREIDGDSDMNDTMQIGLLEMYIGYGLMVVYVP